MTAERLLTQVALLSKLKTEMNMEKNAHFL
jgi:hypothetical protein